jgi:hypothetical protein
VSWTAWINEIFEVVDSILAASVHFLIYVFLLVEPLDFAPGLVFDCQIETLIFIEF